MEVFTFKSEGQAIIFHAIQKGVDIPVESRVKLIELIDEKINNIKNENNSKQSKIMEAIDNLIEVAEGR